jgi:hypothetical protein
LLVALWESTTSQQLVLAAPSLSHLPLLLIQGVSVVIFNSDERQGVCCCISTLAHILHVFHLTTLCHVPAQDKTSFHFMVLDESDFMLWCDVHGALSISFCVFVRELLVVIFVAGVKCFWPPAASTNSAMHFFM